VVYVETFWKAIWVIVFQGNHLSLDNIPDSEEANSGQAERDKEREAQQGHAKRRQIRYILFMFNTVFDLLIECANDQAWTAES
jgi:hypothetical protein